MTGTLMDLDRARPGDLIGYTKHGRPILLVGGAAPRAPIVVDDGDDDDPDATDGDADGDADDDDDGDVDDDGGDDDSVAPPAPAPPKKPDAPTYRELAAEVERLRRGNKRNNAELEKRRITAQWMDKHGITDLDSWLAERNLDKETGQPIPPEPAVDPEIQRRIDREVERRLAQQQPADDGHTAVLSSALARAAVKAELAALRFTGTFDTALRVVNLDDIEIDENGEVVGAAEAAASLKAEIPEWFKERTSQPTRRGGNDVDGGNKRPRPPAVKSWEEQAVGRLLGSG